MLAASIDTSGTRFVAKKTVFPIGHLGSDGELFECIMMLRRIGIMDAAPTADGRQRVAAAHPKLRDPVLCHRLPASGQAHVVNAFQSVAFKAVVVQLAALRRTGRHCQRGGTTC